MYTLSIRQASPPLPIIVLYIFVFLGVFARESEPEEVSLSMFFSILKIAHKQVPIGINLNTKAKFLIINKVALIDLTISGNINPLALSLFPVDLPKINLINILNQLKVTAGKKLLEVNGVIIGEDIIS